MFRQRVVPGVALAAALSLGISQGCSSSSTSGNGGDGAAAPQCDALAKKFCSKAAPCQGDTVSNCEAGFNAGLKNAYGADCTGADAVGTNYDACMAALDSYVCGDSLPSLCNGVLLYR